tara:strand:- start:614 stop:811 length:198 start_codon:yes stop_codon:yes gene_type:complete
MIFKDELLLDHEHSFEHMCNSWALEQQEEDKECSPDLYTSNLDYYQDWAYNFLSEELRSSGLEWT